MKQLTTKFGATIFVEELSHDRHYADRESEEFIKFFDSNEKCFDYFEVETLQNSAEVENTSPQAVLDAYVDGLVACENIESFLEYSGIGWYFASADWQIVAEYMLQEGVYFDEDTKEVSKEDLLNHVCVRVFGKHIIVVEEI